MMGMWIVTAAAALLGIALLGGGVARIASRRVVSGGAGTLFGGVLIAVGAVSGLSGINLQTYHRLAKEQDVGEIAFTATGPRAFEAKLTEPGGAPRTFALAGDSWQLDARVIKFHSWANLLGLDAVYRLDRLSGRYDDIASEQKAARTVHPLSENPGLDVWELARGPGKDVKAIDASYGSGTFVPMADGAVYKVTLTQSGLVARPANPVAEAAVKGWN